MLPRLVDLLPLSLSFSEKERAIRHKVVFLNSVFLMATVVAFVMGFYRWQFSPVMGAIDFLFSAFGLTALYYLRNHHDKVETISNIAILLAFILFMAIFLLAPYNTMRLSLFFLLSAATFYLKGRHIGLRWLFLIIGCITGAHVITGFGTGYSHVDIITTCVYLIALYFIFWNYETTKEAHYLREQEFELQRQVDERWRVALESAGDAIWEWDLQNQTLRYSRSYADMLGYTEEELGHEAELVQRLMHPDDTLESQHRFAATLRAGSDDRFLSEARLRHKDGDYRWILCRGQVRERDARGRALRVVGTSTDITGRKTLEASLKENQHRLHLALDAAKMGVWDLDVATRELYWSPEIYRIGNLDGVPANEAAILSLVHPEDAPRLLAAVNAAIASPRPLSEQYRLMTGANPPIWIEAKGEVQYDANGNVAHIIGTAQDITERILFDAELRSSRAALADERALFQTILDNAPLGVWMLGNDGRARFVNRGFCLATGISEERFLAASHYAEVLPPSVTASCIQSDQECLNQETPHLSTEWIPFVDGRDHLLEITKVRLLNEDGSVRGLIGISADITERKEHERQLEHIAHYDALTGVPNRVLLADRLTQALARTKREQGLMAVCYLDLDGFKPVNDTYGHETGDRVLVEVTRRIKEVIREDDTVARLGGDEFVVLLVGLQVPEECAGSLNRLLNAIHQPFDMQGKLLRISASIGVSLYPEDEQDADTLLRHADQAMYIAKQSGRNRYHLFDAANDLRTRSHHELLQQIRHGLAHDEFELYYQPKVEMRTGRLVGVEALIRWHHPKRGFLPPGEFLRAIENTELEIELGDWVFSHAFAQLQQWRTEAHNFEVSINASAYHLQSTHFVSKLKTLMEQHCAQHCQRCVQVEVLETAALEDIARVSSIIKACREFGVGFALDDFGTGYSSLTYLSNLDVDTLKIDQSFVRGMLEDKGDHAIVQGIIALAKAFDRNIVAEGVETDEHYRALLQMGCEIAQGYGIARPMPASDLITWSQQWSPSKSATGAV